MPRDGSGTYSLASNTLAVSGDAISSTKFNSLVQDLESDANVDRPIAAGGTGASTASAARTNLGLAIGTDVQAFDAGLLSIAGLTTLADRSIYTTASDTYAVYTLTAAGRAILDDADAAAQRTTLGLGTAALKNTGTSGDAVPLLNVANTFSAAQGLSNNIALNILETGGTARSVVKMNTSNEMEFGNANNNASFLNNTVNFAGAGDFTRSGNTIWHAGNDGAGSGLDADLLDGYNVGTSGATIPVLNAANTFSASNTFGPLQTFTNPGNASFGAAIELKTTAATDDIALAMENYNGGSPVRYALSVKDDGALAFSSGRYSGAIGTERMTLSSAGVLAIGGNTVWHAGNDGAGSGLDADTLDGVQGSAYAALAGATFTGDVTATKFTVGTFVMDDNIGLGADIPGFNFDSNDWFVYQRTDNYFQFAIASNEVLRINSTGIKARPAASAETTGTLTSASANTTIQATGDITIPNAVFAAGDIILIYAGASSRTITEGASVTMRLGGTATTGSRTLAARGVAVLFFVSSSEVVVSGGAVT